MFGCICDITKVSRSLQHSWDHCHCSQPHWAHPVVTFPVLALTLYNFSQGGQCRPGDQWCMLLWRWKFWKAHSYGSNDEHGSQVSINQAYIKRMSLWSTVALMMKLKWWIEHVLSWQESCYDNVAANQNRVTCNCWQPSFIHVSCWSKTQADFLASKL